jgi:aldehyde:ferredoxin oxidoreductase
MFGPEKILKIDLEKQTSYPETISQEVLADTVGGIGLGVKLLLDSFSPGTSWDSPENPMIFLGGPISGTRVPGGGAFCVVSQGAMTGMLASSQANGFFGAFMRNNGYLGLYITGKSSDWVYLLLQNGQLYFRSASHLLGMDTYKMAETIEAELGLPRQNVSIYGIGPAGENLVRFAAIVGDYGHVAAHNGLGAVMGSKKIKAVVAVRGSEKVPEADSELLKKIVKEQNDLVRGGAFAKWGTAANLSKHYMGGRLPIKNYTTNRWPSYVIMDGPSLRERYPSKVKPCWNCGLHCRWVEVPVGPYAGTQSDEPEYECIAACSSQIDNKDPDKMIALANLIDRQGLDVNETGWVLGWAMEGLEKGWLSKDFLDGINLKWGNVEAAMELVEKISRRQGVGSFLADGVKRCAETLGGEAYQAGIFTLRGNTPRGHDHRGNWNELLDTCLSDTGTIEITGGTADYSELDVEPPRNRFDPLEIARTNAQFSGRRQFEDCLVICRFTAPKFRLLVECVNAVTGWRLDVPAALKISRRAINRMRIYNLLRGLEPTQEWPSPRYGSTPVDGPNAGKSFLECFPAMRQAYWRFMGWDENTGRPLPETLKELNLDEWIPILQSR